MEFKPELFESKKLKFKKMMWKIKLIPFSKRKNPVENELYEAISIGASPTNASAY